MDIRNVSFSPQCLYASSLDPGMSASLFLFTFSPTLHDVAALKKSVHDSFCLTRKASFMGLAGRLVSSSFCSLSML